MMEDCGRGVKGYDHVLSSLMSMLTEAYSGFIPIDG